MSSLLSGGLGGGAGVAPSAWRIMPPRIGGKGLLAVDAFFGALRDLKEPLAVEVYADGGVVSYVIRSRVGQSLRGVVQSTLTQARLTPLLPVPTSESEDGDWLRLSVSERAVVVPLWLGREAFLPLRILSDQQLAQGEVDPLAPVLGALASATARGSAHQAPRLGVRMVLRAVQENWGAGWQESIQRRRDREDLVRPNVVREAPGVTSDAAVVLGLGLMLLLGAGYANWSWWNSGDWLKLVGLDLAGAAGLAGAAWAYRKWGKKQGRAFFDDVLVEQKLGSQGFAAEIQLIAISNDVVHGMEAGMIRNLRTVYRGFDFAAGNHLVEGRPTVYLHGAGAVPSGKNAKRNGIVQRPAAELMSLRWLGKRQAAQSVLGMREVSTLWHLPLGLDDMAAMERAGPVQRMTPLYGLEGGALIGHTEGLEEQPVHITDDVLVGHCLLVGKSGGGKSTILKHIMDGKFKAMAQGKNPGAVVFVDPHSDAVREVLRFVPESEAHRVRLLDLGRDDRLPALNILDPVLFPDRDRCVDTIVQMLRHIWWEHWGPRINDLISRSTRVIHTYNSHPDTPRSEMMTFMDIPRMLQGGRLIGQGNSAIFDVTPFQNYVLNRVEDEELRNWFYENLYKWPAGTRSDALAPVMSRIGAYSSNSRARVLLGQRESTIVLSDVIERGEILLVSTAAGTIGEEPAALMGATIIALLDSALRQQQVVDEDRRKKCTLIVDEFHSILGVNWEEVLSGSRKFGLSVVLATQSVVRLDMVDRNLKDGVLDNTKTLIAYSVSAENARILSEEMDRELVSMSSLISLAPHHCYVKMATTGRRYDPFSMKVLPPPDKDGGSDAAYNAVVSRMHNYTYEWSEAVQRMEDDQRGMMMLGKLDNKVAEAAKPSVYDTVDAVPREDAEMVEPPTGRDGTGDGVAAGDAPGSRAGAEETGSGGGNTKPVGGGDGGGNKAGVRSRISDEAKRNSRYSAELLEQMVSDGGRDPGLNEVFEYVNKGRVRSIVMKKEEEIRADERSKLGMGTEEDLGSDSPAGSEREVQGSKPRDLTRLQRPFGNR